MPPKAANKRKSVGDAPNDREKKVRSNGDEPSVQEQHDRAKQWNEQRQAARSKSPAPRRQSAAAGAKSPAVRRSKASSKSNESSDDNTTVTPVVSPTPKTERSSRRQTVDVPAKPRSSSKRTAPLASTMEETKSLGFRTIEERQNSQPSVLAPKRSFGETSVGGQRKRDSVDTGVGILPYIIFMSVSFAVIYASLFCTKTCEDLFALAEDAVMLRAHGVAALVGVPLHAFTLNAYTGTCLFGVWLFLSFFSDP
jgi:hypothetical protein